MQTKKREIDTGAIVCAFTALPAVLVSLCLIPLWSDMVSFMLIGAAPYLCILLWSFEALPVLSHVPADAALAVSIGLSSLQFLAYALAVSSSMRRGSWRKTGLLLGSLHLVAAAAAGVLMRIWI